MGHQIKPRVFPDSNVLFSALYSPDGAPGAILNMFAKGQIRVVVSRQVLEEIVRTLKEKLPEALPALNELLVSIPPEVVEDPSPEEVARWAAVIHRDDAPILAAAITDQPDYLVTGDNHFFNDPRVAEVSALRIATPGQLLEALGG